MNKYDKAIRFAAYVVGRVIPAILALIFIAIVVIPLRWLLDDPPGRIGPLSIAIILVTVPLVLVDLWLDFVDSEEDSK